MIEVHNLSKRFCGVLAVDSSEFNGRPGIVTGLLGPIVTGFLGPIVTGLLGPNCAGKSTTMRMIMGLDRPTNRWAGAGQRQAAEGCVGIFA